MNIISYHEYIINEMSSVQIMQHVKRVKTNRSGLSLRGRRILQRKETTKITSDAFINS